jgi:hypothetical protein
VPIMVNPAIKAGVRYRPTLLAGARSPAYVISLHLGVLFRLHGI